MTYYIYTGDLIKNGCHYGDFEPIKNIQDYKKTELYIMPDQLSGSYYTGGCLNRSNYKAFLKLFSQHEGVYTCYGLMGTYAIVIRADKIEDPEISSVLNDLDEYPLIDEDIYREIQDDTQKEAWENWVRSDLISAIKKEIDEYNLDWEPDDSFDSLFDDCREESGVDWQEESDNSMYLNTGKLAPYMAENILVTIMPKKLLPLLTNHKWLSKTARNIWESKLKGVTNG